MATVDVRPALIDDLPRLTAIYNNYVTNTPITFDLEPFSVDERQAWFSQFADGGRNRLLVADAQGEVVGYAGSHQFRTKKAYDTTVETTIYCAPDSLGRGIGQLLYGALFDSLRGEDVRTAMAGITLPNDASVGLHESFGFVPVGVMREVGRKFGKYWDVAWYQRAL